MLQDILLRNGWMELRHLRYFVAVAEEGSLTLAAQKRLHTAQPSLSRQIHDLELELGVQLLNRGPRGVELTAAGRVFLDHARGALLQVEAGGAPGADVVRARLPHRLRDGLAAGRDGHAARGTALGRDHDPQPGLAGS